MRSVGGIHLPLKPDLDALELLCVRINSIDTWLKLLKSNCVWRCLDYQMRKKEFLQTMIKTKPEPTPGDLKINGRNF